jgi:hypothetical protein
MITLIPTGGLANRMKAIDSAILLARHLSAKLRIFWFRDSGLNCRFDQLFEPLEIPGVELIEATTSDLLLYDRPRKKNLWIPRLYQKVAFDACIYVEEATRLYREDFDFKQWAANKNVYLASCIYFYPDEGKRFQPFRPIKPLALQIEEGSRKFSSDTIGIHIRRTDNIASIQQSPIELFIAEMRVAIATNVRANFYLASDSIPDKERLKELFGQRIITSDQAADRNSLEGMQNALVELWLLSKTKRIIGSAQSSFSETAAEISGIECRIVRK